MSKQDKINQGWIKIESEKDLPKEECNYWVIYKTYPDNVSELSWHGGSRFLGRQQNEMDFWPENISHYQPIQKPKPPIY